MGQQSFFFFFLESSLPITIVASFDEPRWPLLETSKRNILRRYYEYEHFDLKLPCGHSPWGAGLDMFGLQEFLLLRWMLAWPNLPAACFSSTRFPLGRLRDRGVGELVCTEKRALATL